MMWHHLIEDYQRRKLRRLVWEDMRRLGFDVVPLRELGSHGPILTEKGLQQVNIHVAARDRPRGQG